MPFKVKLTCVEVKEGAKCVHNHKMGDIVIFDGPNINGRLCPDVLEQILPKVSAIRYGARLPWGKNWCFQCSDPENTIIFKIEPAGLTSEPFYQEGQMKLLEKIEENPGVKLTDLPKQFTEQEKESLWLTDHRIKVYLNELIDVNKLYIQDDQVYPTSAMI